MADHYREDYTRITQELQLHIFKSPPPVLDPTLPHPPKKPLPPVPSEDSTDVSYCVYVCNTMYVCVCMCLCMYMCMYVCAYVCMYVCMYVCTVVWEKFNVKKFSSLVRHDEN